MLRIYFRYIDGVRACCDFGCISLYIGLRIHFLGLSDLRTSLPRNITRIAAQFFEAIAKSIRDYQPRQFEGTLFVHPSDTRTTIL
jgi:hypothetical protein